MRPEQNYQAQNYHSRRPIPFVRYRDADWTQNNAVLAEQYHVSRERIRVIRKKLGKPKVTGGRRRWEYNQRLAETIARLQAMPMHQREWNLAWLERELGVPRCRLEAAYQRLGWQPGRVCPHAVPWELLNFDLSNRDLERIWQLTKNVVGCYRKKRRIGPAKFDARKMMHGRILPGYDEAIRAEEIKAQQFLNQS